MTHVLVEETPGGDTPRAKAEGDVLGFETQLAERQEDVVRAQARLTRARAEVVHGETIVDNTVIAVAEVEEALAAARTALAKITKEAD